MNYELKLIQGDNNTMSRLPLDTQFDDDEDFDTVNDEFEGLTEHFKTRESAEVEQSYQSQQIERQLKENHCETRVTAKHRHGAESQ